MTNNFTPNELPKFNAAICCGTITKNGGTFGASEKDGAARKIDGAAHRKCWISAPKQQTELFLHWNISPKRGRRAERTRCCRAKCILLCLVTTRTRKNLPHRTPKARPHAQRRADSAADCCTQNIVPSEKMQLEYCAA